MECPLISYAIGAAFGKGTTGLDLFESMAGAGDFLQDFFDTGRPDKGRRVGVPRGEEGGDGLFQIFHATKRTPAHSLLAEL